MEKNLHKWLNDDLSSEEEADLRSSPEFEENNKVIQAVSGLEVPSFDQQKAWEQLKAKRATTMEQSPLKNVFSRRLVLLGGAIAASVVLILAFGLGWFSSRTVVKTIVQEKRNVSLPDGSYVILNAGSQISYKERNFSKRRIVHLEGEAQFFVRRDSVGFLVDTKEGAIGVLGTTFNVYSRKDGFKVSCYIGKVRVRKSGTTLELKSAEKAVWKDGDLKKEAELYAEPDWTTGESVFIEEPLTKVVAELERQYGLEVDLDVSQTYYYTGGFEHGLLQEAMDNIVEPFDLRYEQDGKRMRIWEKEK